MKNILQNRKMLYAILGGLILVVIVIGLILGKGDGGNKIETENGLKINNNNRLEVHAKGVSTSEILKSTIVIENPTDSDKTYIIEWKDVTNSYATGQDLTYTINGQSDGTRNIGKSQIPVVPITILDSITIAAGATHTYEVSVSYAKSEESQNNADSEFTGYLVVTSS